ncbi:hypothetical protein [Saccharopolyspora shandongensis]|uniref:hypothetical protein n=1 Tax=Saccharopolyspora shandongensis TaxID=418495 RepID=UPI0033E65F83
MQEELLREGMRAAVGDEPPLGFSPDDLVAEGRKRQRRRRATIGAVAATLVVAGAATVPGMMAGSMPIVPATPQVSAVKPIEWPPKNVTPMLLSEAQLGVEAERMRGHLAEAIPAVDPAAFDVTTSHPHGRGPGFRAKVPGIAYVQATFKYVIASSGQSVELPIRLMVIVQAPGTVTVPPSQGCGPGSEGTVAVLSCTQRTLDDGSIVVESVTSLVSAGNDGPKTHIVRHFRVDGSLVSATASHSAGQEASGLGAYRQAQMDRLDRIATDPQFALKG